MLAHFRPSSRFPSPVLSGVARVVVGGTLGLTALVPGAAAASPMAIDVALHVQPEEDAAAPEGTPPEGEPAPVEGQDPPPTETPETPETEAATPEGPPPDEGEYATSKEAGQGMSGREAPEDDTPLASERVGDQKVKPKELSHVKTGQVGAAAGVGFGMRTAGDKYCGAFSDDENDQDKRKSLCTARTPAVLDLTLGFGANDRIDIVVGVRVNLEKRDYDNGPCREGDLTCVAGKGLFVNARGIGVMPGVRVWGSDNNKVFKVGGAVDILYMYENFEGYRNRPPLDDSSNNVQENKGNPDPDNESDEDKVGDHILGLRGGPILQVDPHHNVGIFFIPAAVPTFRPQQGNATNSGWFEISFEATLGVQARFP